MAVLLGGDLAGAAPSALFRHALGLMTLEDWTMVSLEGLAPHHAWPALERVLAAFRARLPIDNGDVAAYVALATNHLWTAPGNWA